MPRRYSMARRAEQQAGTRARILAAAIELYRAQGVAAATIPVVARAADVAPATVRKYFPTPGDLAAATGEAVLADLHPPEPTIFAGLDSVGDRAERLARELLAFFERSNEWWYLMQREPDLAAAWAGAAARYEADFARLVRAALGGLSDDEVAYAVLAAVVGPPLHFALQGGGLSAAQAVEIEIELVRPWLEARQR